jgi:hypothetical protein
MSGTRPPIDDGGARATASDVVFRSDSGRLNAAASGIALLVSGVSLWETVVKQPDLSVFIGDNVSYTRDPYGSTEVVVMPITIANSGARDGAVISMRLDVKSSNGQSERLDGAYTAEAAYFGASDNVSTRQRRPKTPFAPLSIAGRSAFSGVVLFYTMEGREGRVIEPKTRFEGVLTITATPPAGWIDRLLTSKPDTVAVRYEVPNFLPGALMVGDFVRLKPVAEAPKP